MFDRFRHATREFARHRPGRRFESRYRRAREVDHGMARRAARVGGGAVVFVLGIVMVPAPGPGLLVMLAGATLVAQEMLPVARRLDRGELWLRSRGRGLRRWWRQRGGSGTT